jgi:hypothetical protein
MYVFITLNYSIATTTTTTTTTATPVPVSVEKGSHFTLEGGTDRPFVNVDKQLST